MENDVSASTIFRYSKTGRKAQLPAFLQLKSQYMNYFSPNRMAAIRKVYHHGICGRNQHRHLVVVDRIGNLKVQQVTKLFEEDELIHFFNQRLLHLSQEVLQEKDQLIWIVDLNGKIMQLASKKILESLHKVISNMQNYFPDILHRLVFINTPMLFDTIWNKIGSSIHPRTQQKIIMLGDQLQNLYEFAEPSILPSFLGGDIDQQTFLSGQKEQKKDSESSQEEQIDFSQLKQALGGLKISGKSLQSVSQTPLNTEADQKNP